MQNERSRGIELLRAFAALLVVAIHVFPLCAPVNREPYAAAPLPDLFFYALALCGVNCFGLISGYVGYRDEPTPPRLSPLVLIWLQMVLSAMVSEVLSKVSVAVEVLLSWPATKSLRHIGKEKVFLGAQKKTFQV